MQLFLLQVCFHRVQSGPVGKTGSESLKLLQPSLAALLCGMSGMSIEPVLEGIDGGNPGKCFQHIMQLLVPGPQQIVFRRKEVIPILHGKRSEEHTSELQSLMRISYAVFCLKKKKKK